MKLFCSVNWFAFLFTDEVRCFSGHLAAFVKWMFRAARCDSSRFTNLLIISAVGIYNKYIPTAEMICRFVNDDLKGKNSWQRQTEHDLGDYGKGTGMQTRSRGRRRTTKQPGRVHRPCSSKHPFHEGSKVPGIRTSSVNKKANQFTEITTPVTASAITHGAIIVATKRPSKIAWRTVHKWQEYTAINATITGPPN